MAKRKIGAYTGAANGTLVIVLAAMHGNEPTGVRALQTLLAMLESEPNRNPYFQFRGKIVGLIGNIQAYERRVRFVKTDFNRHLTADNLARVRRADATGLAFEDLELLELIDAIEAEIATYLPEKLVVVDIHTTSADGGIFSVVASDTASLAIAKTLPVPVVTGLVSKIGGSTLHYFSEENTGFPTIKIGFEAGQHEDPLSTRRAIAWLVNLLRAVNVVRSQDVENRHEDILRGYTKHLPQSVELIYKHPIATHDQFQMLPDFKNFQPVRKGEILAKDKNGFIAAPEDGLILMPLYQRQGTEGFFLVKAD
jgi:succinylglutamate desuccinylase